MVSRRRAGEEAYLGNRCGRAFPTLLPTSGSPRQGVRMRQEASARIYGGELRWCWAATLHGDTTAADGDIRQVRGVVGGRAKVRYAQRRGGVCPRLNHSPACGACASFLRPCSSLPRRNKRKSAVTPSRSGASSPSASANLPDFPRPGNGPRCASFAVN